MMEQVLIAVSPEIYTTLYPHGIEKASYEKLLCHEMAHRLHIRILNGDEECMGPVWFFEGFAIYAVGQFEASSRELTKEEAAAAVVSNPERGDYRLYGSLIRTLLGHASLKELLKRAAREGSTDYVSKLVSKT